MSSANHVKHGSFNQSTRQNSSFEDYISANISYIGPLAFIVSVFLFIVSWLVSQTFMHRPFFLKFQSNALSTFTQVSSKALQQSSSYLTSHTHMPSRLPLSFQFCFASFRLYSLRPIKSFCVFRATWPTSVNSASKWWLHVLCLFGVGGVYWTQIALRWVPGLHYLYKTGTGRL